MPEKQAVLLNVCCSNCATHTVSDLREKGYEPVTYFYNPNIHPEEEYKKRYNDMVKLAVQMNIKNIETPPYDTEEWKKRCSPYANEPEGGARCAECFKLRMEKTAEKTKELGIYVFAVTLTISPHKKASLINSLGKKAAKKYNLEYYESDFKKKDGFKKSVDLSKKHGLYRQKYCGCVYSMAEK